MVRHQEGYTYKEEMIPSAGTKIMLSIWETKEPKATVVFVPGTMAHPLFYEAFLDALAIRGYNVLGIHPISHGKSLKTIKGFTINDIVQNAVDTAALAHELYGLPVIMSGSSQGGIVASQAATECEGLTAVIAHGVMLTDMPETVGILRAPRFLEKYYWYFRSGIAVFATLFSWVKIPLWLYLDPERISLEPYYWIKMISDPYLLPGYSLKFLNSLSSIDYQPLTDGSCQTPFYCVYGSEDELFSPEYTKRVFRRIKAPYKELIEIQDLPHLFMLTHPDTVADCFDIKIQEAILMSGCGVKTAI